MAGRRRQAPGDGPFLGMIVDKSSFDEDDKKDTDDLTVDTQVAALPRRRDGKVRRKLRWKPPAFRSKKRMMKPVPSSGASVMSTQTKNSFHTFHSTETPVQSNKTNEVRKPIGRPNYSDTFEGVSTIDNEGKFIHADRFPNGSDKGKAGTPSGFAAEDRMVPPTEIMSDSISDKWDFAAISENDDGGFGAYRNDDDDDLSLGRVYDPADGSSQGAVDDSDDDDISDSDHHDGVDGKPGLSPNRRDQQQHDHDVHAFMEEGIELDDLVRSCSSDMDAKKRVASPGEPPLRKSFPGRTSNKMESPGEAPLTPLKLKDVSPDSPNPLDSTVSTQDMTEDDLDSTLSAFFREEIENERQIGFFRSRFGTKNEPDLATGFGVSPIRRSGPAMSPFTTPTKASLGKPPKFPIPKQPTIIRFGPTNDTNDSSSPFLGAGSRLGFSVNQSPGLGSFGSAPSSPQSDQTPDHSFPDMPVTRAVNNANTGSGTGGNRVPKAPKKKAATAATRADAGDVAKSGSLLSSPSSSPAKKQLFTDDPTNQSDNVVVISSADATQPIVGGVVKHGSREVRSTPQKAGKGTTRARTGPVDVDDVAFVEAERNLKAIHEMAAEHLAHGEYVEALEVFEEILRGQKQRYGEEHYRIGTALHNIGIVHLKSGNNSKAVEVCQNAVAIRKKALVSNHPDVAVSLAQLGVAHLECAEFRDALVAFREALQIRREFLGPRHPKVAKILNNIGCTLYELDELDGAMLAFQEALEIQKESLRSAPSPRENDGVRAGSDATLLSIAATLANIGSIRLQKAQTEEATVALEEALLVSTTIRHCCCHDCWLWSFPVQTFAVCVTIAMPRFVGIPKS